MPSHKVANAYIVITPKFDNLKKTITGELDGAAVEASMSFGDKFNAGLNKIIKEGINTSIKETVKTFTEAGLVAGDKFSQGFAKSAPQINKTLSENAMRGADSVHMSAAGRRAGKEFVQALSGSISSSDIDMEKAFRVWLYSTEGKILGRLSRLKSEIAKEMPQIQAPALTNLFNYRFGSTIEAASQAGRKIANAISKPLSAVADKVIPVMRPVGTKVGDALLHGAVTGITALVNRVRTAFSNDIPGAISRAAGRITSLVKSIFTGAVSAVSSATSAGVRFGTSLVEGIRTGLSNGVGVIKSIMTTLVPNGKSYGLTFSKQFLTGWRSGGAIAGITSAIAYTGIFGVLNTIGEASTNAISRVDTMANYPRVMEALGFANDLATESVNKMSDALDGLPTRLNDITNTVAGYTASLGDLKQATDVGLALNNMMLAGGQGTAMANSALEQFRQILTKGKPDLQDWKSLMVSAPGQMKQLAQAMLGEGATTNDLYEYIGGGVKDADFKDNEAMYKEHMQEFLNAIVKLNKEGTDQFESFEKQARKATKGIATSLENFKTRASKVAAAVLDAIGQITIAEKIDEISYAMQNKLAPFLATITTSVKESIDYEAMGEFWKNFKAVSEKYFPTGEAAAKKYGQAIGNLINRFTALDSKALPILDTLWGLTARFMKWLGSSALKFFESFITRLADNMPRINEAIKQTSETLAQAFPSDGGTAAAFGETLGEAITILIEHLPTAAKSIKQFSEDFHSVFGDVNFTDKFLDTLTKALDFMLDAFSGFTSTLDVQKFKDVGQGIADALGLAFGDKTVKDMSAGNIFGSMLATMANSAVKLLEALTPTIAVLAKGFEPVLDWIKNNLPGIVQNIGDFISTVMTGTDWKAIGDSIYNFFKSFADGLGLLSSGPSNISLPTDKIDELNANQPFGQMAGEAVAKAFNELPGILDKLAPVAHDFAETMRDLVTNIDFEAWRETLNTVFEEIHKGFSDGEGDTKSFGETLADVVEDIRIIVDTLAKSGIIEKISKLIKDLLDVSNAPAIMALLGGAGLGIAGLQIGSLFGPEGAAIGGLAGAILGAGLGGVFGESFSEFAKANQVSPEEYKKRIDDLIAKAPQLGLSEKDVYRKTLTDPYYGWMTDGPLGAFLTTLLKIRFAIEDLGEAWTNFWDGAAQAVENAKNTMVGAFNAVAEAISGIGDAILGLPDWISSNWDSFVNSLPKFDFGADVNWGIPMMASGGRANRPTLALIGEGNSDEAVLPLNSKTYDELAAGINQRQLTDGSNNAELLEGLRALMGSMTINLDGTTLGRVSAPYNDRALGARSRLANRGVAMA